MFVQVTVMLVITFFVFQMPCRGNFGWVLLLAWLQGSCGMAYGLIVSAFCREENSAFIFTIGSLLPNLLLCGSIWPTEAMPVVVKLLSNFLPQTLPIESMRYILSRGW